MRKRKRSAGRNFLSFFRTLRIYFPIPDTIEIEERQGTYTSERIVDEDESGRALKGGHDFWFV